MNASSLRSLTLIAGALGTMLVLTGCGVAPTGSAVSGVSAPAVKLSGRVHGGQQPVSGSQVYLYAVSTTETAGPATSLLMSPGYVVSDASGNFSITGDYTCPAGAYVYLLALGGNPGLAAGTNNPDLALAAGLGACSSLSASTTVTINEVTTVAMAYSLAGYATSETNIGADTSVSNPLPVAFANNSALVNLTTGSAMATTPNGGIVPQATINSLANAIAACVNSDGTGSACANLMSYSQASAGGGPIDTFQAILNIAQNPGFDVVAILGLAGTSPPFQPSLSSSPADLTLPIQYPPSLSISPASATISQIGQQTFSAVLSGDSAGTFSYLWSLSAHAYGLLNEVGGTGQTNQTSYCSTSAQSTFIPNASPALTSNGGLNVQVSLYSGTGCSNANFITSTGVPIVVTPAPTNVALPGFPTTLYTSTVVLPPGSTLTPEQVTVLSGVTQVTPSPSGTFTIPVYSFDSQIAVVQSPNGSPMLTGWLDATHSYISANSTAEVLAFYALGGPLLATEAQRNTLEAAILDSPGLPALTAVIATELAANPDALANLDTNVQSALNTYFTSVTGIVPTTPALSKSGATASLAKPRDSSSGTGMLVTPGDQSGENVESLPPFQADISNTYRRRTHAFVQRVSDTPSGAGATPVADPADITDFEVAPTVGVNGGLTGAITDIYNEAWGNTTAAYAPTTSDPFDLPLTSGYAKTNYVVTIVGPGLDNQGLYSGLTPTQKTEQFNVAVGGFITDALIPLMSNFVFGSGYPPDAGQATATVSVGAFAPEWKMDLKNDFLLALSTLPALQTQITTGDYKGALASVIDSIRQGQTFRNVLISSVQQAATKQLPSGASWVSSGMTGGLQIFNSLLNAVGGGLQIFDSSVYATQLAKSDSVDQWSVVVGGAKITLSPASTTINQYGAGNQTLTANVLGVTTTGYSYLWSNTAQAGDIQPLTGSATNTGNSFCSSSNVVNYLARTSPVLTTNITDKITVSVFTTGNCTAANGLGSAVAGITVTPDGVVIAPYNSTIPQSGTAPLAATVSGATPSGASYQWTVTGSGGNAAVGVLNEVGGSQTGPSFCSASPNATYQPNPSPTLSQNATDNVTVQAFSTASCTANSLGTSSPVNVTVSAGTVVISPANSQIKQGNAQSLAATVSGVTATTFYYQWSLSGSDGNSPVGTLQDTAGTGKSGYSICTKIGAIGYVPNATPQISQATQDIVSVQVFLDAACTTTGVTGAVSTTVTVLPMATNKSIPLPWEINSVLQASDGNYYGVSGNFYGAGGSGSGPNGLLGPQNGAIYRVTPDGEEVRIYTFPDSGANGVNPTSLIEGPDGYLYGIAQGVYFRLSFAGQFTVLNSAITTQDSVYTNILGAGTLQLGSDGAFYVPSGPDLFRLTTSGAASVAGTLVGYNGCTDQNDDSGLRPPDIQSWLQGSDGNFYVTVLGNQTSCLTGGIGFPNYNYPAVLQITPAGAVSTTAYVFWPPNYPSSSAIYAPVEASDGGLYANDAYAAVEVVYPGGGQSPFVAIEGGINYYGYIPPYMFSSSLALGSDGNLYATANGTSFSGGITWQGDPDCNQSTGAGCTVLAGGSTHGGFTPIHVFQGGTDGLYPVGGAPLQNSNGELIGTATTVSFVAPPTAYSGTIYQINNNLPPPIQLSFSPSTAFANSSVTLNWNVLNAFSLTAQQCYAFVQNNAAGAGTWTGKQTGTATGAGYSGSATITPTAPGTYTYAMTCGGVESGFATLTVQ